MRNNSRATLPVQVNRYPDETHTTRRSLRGHRKKCLAKHRRGPPTVPGLFRSGRKMAHPTGFEPLASAFGAATNPRHHDSRRQPALQLPFPSADRIQRETVAAGRRTAEILLAACRAPPDRRIRESWARFGRSNGSRGRATQALVDALASFGPARPR